VASGGPITVTDREVTRFFMTIHEAVQLVIQAAAIGRPGEVLVLDMGEPVRIDDVARRMARQSDAASIEIVYTGLKPGEKLHEVLFGHGENDRRPIHPLVSHVDVPGISRDALVHHLKTERPVREDGLVGGSGDDFAEQSSARPAMSDLHRRIRGPRELKRPVRETLG
jgi:FlaA1/EpsC-like NDP-sugar epimerase